MNSYDDHTPGKGIAKCKLAYRSFSGGRIVDAELLVLGFPLCRKQHEGRWSILKQTYTDGLVMIFGRAVPCLEAFIAPFLLMATLSTYRMLFVSTRLVTMGAEETALPSSSRTWDLPRNILCKSCCCYKAFLYATDAANDTYRITDPQGDGLWIPCMILQAAAVSKVGT